MKEEEYRDVVPPASQAAQKEASCHGLLLTAEEFDRFLTWLHDEDAKPNEALKAAAHRWNTSYIGVDGKRYPR